MKVCIVGSTGLVGSALKKRLSSEYDVVCLDRHTSDISKINIDSLSKLYRGVSVFINCAAIMNASSTQRLMEVNAIGALNVAKLATYLDARLIHLSSISCEEDKSNEYFNHYGVSKLAGELLVQDHFSSYRKNDEFSIVRCSQIYDLEWKASISQPFIYNIIKSVINNKPIVIYGQNNVTRNYVSINTVVESIANMVSCTSLKSGYILGKSLTISEVLDLVSSSLNKNIEVTWDADKTSLKEIYIPSEIDKLSSGFETSFSHDIKEIAKNEKK